MSVVPHDISDFERRLEVWIEKINSGIMKGLDEVLQSAPDRDHFFIRKIYDHIYEYLKNGGKRMHGVSILLAYRVAGGCKEREILPVAAAFQLYHHHTLIHDDIYDEDLKRRGFLTAHYAFSKYFNEIAGHNGAVKNIEADAFFSSPSHRKGVVSGFAIGKIVHAIAFELMMRPEIPADKAMQILKMINLHDLADNSAQLKDVFHEGKGITSSEESLGIAHAKTGILFGVGVECAALLAGCSHARAESLKTWILCTAKAYQLQDDLEDFAADSEKGMGRGVGTDLKTKKPTFILATAIEQASDEDRDIIRSWLCTHESNTGSDEVLRILENTGALLICSRKVRQLINEGISALENKEANISEEDKEDLRKFSEYFISDRYWKRALPNH